MIPTKWLSGKCKTMKTTKRSLVEHGEHFGQWKYPVWYHHDGYISIHISVHSKPIEYTPQRVNHNVNYEFGVIICVNVGSSVVANVQLWWGMLIMGELMHVWAQEAYGKSLQLLNLLSTYNFSKIIVFI